MKKIAILVASILVLGGFGTRTFADEIKTQTEQTTGTSESVVSYKEDAGITPDNLLYVIDKAVDQLRITLANSTEKKAAVITEIAEERLGESEVMTEKGKIELAQKTLEEYNKKITEAANKLQEVVANLEASEKEGLDAAAEENLDEKLEQSLIDLATAIQQAQEKSLAVLDSLKNAAPEESVKSIEKVIEEQTAHKEAVANFVAERHEFNAAKKSLNMAKVALKKLEKSGNEEDLKAAQAKLTEAQKEYMTAQTELHAAFKTKKTADLKIEQNKEKASQSTPEEKAVVEGNNQTVEEANKAEEVPADKENVKAEPAAKSDEYTKTNNGNGNGNKSTKVEEEKKDKETAAPAKAAEEPGKSGQANGKKK